MIGDAINYPTQHDDWLEIILIGGALGIASIIPFIGLIGSLLLAGYYVRVLRSAAKDEKTPPVFDEWAELLVDGLKYVGIALTYVLIPSIIATLLLSILGLDSLVGLLIAFLIVLVAMYLLPAALTNFALTDSVDNAFDLGTVTDAAFTGEYFIAIVLTVLIGSVLGSIGSLFMIVLVGFAVVFYVNIVVHYIVARGCAPALRQDATEEFAT